MKDSDPRQIADEYLAEFAERERLATLSNQELVAEAWNLDLDEIPVIVEMMRRLDPEWLEHQEEKEKKP
jgi:hypothetical protein